MPKNFSHKVWGLLWGIDKNELFASWQKNELFT